jgi:transcriptional regulator with XRE-family HTH domain
MATPQIPDMVDVHVGKQMRFRRKLLKMSQEVLAEALNITFQQIQKYEKGANRVSASKMYQAAQVLNVPVSYFFEGLVDGGTPDTENSKVDMVLREFVYTAEGLEIAQKFPMIQNPNFRRQVLSLVRAFTDDAGDTEIAA